MGWERHHGTDLILVFWFWRKHRETWNPQISWTCQMFPKRSLLVISQGWGCLSNPCWWWCQAANVWRQIWQTDLNPSVTSEAFNVFLGLQKCPHWLQFFPGWYIRHDCHLRKAQVRTSSAIFVYLPISTTEKPGLINFDYSLREVTPQIVSSNDSWVKSHWNPPRFILKKSQKIPHLPGVIWPSDMDIPWHIPFLPYKHIQFDISRVVILCYIWLVVSIPLKNMKVSWDCSSQYMEK